MSMQQESPVTERLREALRLRNRSPYWLQRQLSRQGVPGSSTGSVNRYVRGEITPPIEFLQTAARALDVFEPWLLSGYGHPDQRPSSTTDPRWTVVLEGNERMEKILDEWAENDRNVEYRLEDRFFGFRALPETTRRIVLDLFERCGQYTQESRYCIVPWDSFQTRHGFDLGLAHQLGSILYAPIQMLGLRDFYPPPHEPSPDQLNQYVLALCTAIAWLLPEREEPTDEELTEQRKSYELWSERIRYWQEQQGRGALKPIRRAAGQRRNPVTEGAENPL